MQAPGVYAWAPLPFPEIPTELVGNPGEIPTFVLSFHIFHYEPGVYPYCLLLLLL
jgi:hypothetical protein